MDVEEQWTIACRHAGYEPEREAWLYEVARCGGPNGALHIRPGTDVVREPDWPLTDEQIQSANAAQRRDGHRVLVRKVPSRPLLGLLRHELEHAVQYDASPETYDFMYIVQHAIGFAYHDAGLPTLEGSAGIYNALPHEVDANRAARSLFDDQTIAPEAEDLSRGFGNLWRETGPYDASTLPCRLVAFASIFPDVLERAAAEECTTVSTALRAIDIFAEQMWLAASADSDIAVGGVEALSLAPSVQDVHDATTPALAWTASADCLRKTEALAVDRHGW